MLKLTKFERSPLTSSRLSSSDLRDSLPLICALTLVALFDFTQRVVPEWSLDETLERDLEMPNLTHSGRLADDYFRQYSQKLRSLSEKPEVRERLLVEGGSEGKLGEGDKNVDRSVLQLLGVFKDDSFFAVVKHFIDDEGGYKLSKLTLGAEIQGLSVKSISSREVILAGGNGDLKVLRLFDLNLSDEI